MIKPKNWLEDVPFPSEEELRTLDRIFTQMPRRTPMKFNPWTGGTIKTCKIYRTRTDYLTK